ncbi:glycosyltransferase family 2 protein [Bacillus sp. RG28]|uniref:Glycosyltransferase family 2 protein n=1 Tax=Gottfriedia endophytica TaxID=2820819 RepID=A0A940SKX5_9BACI|nr:glycosyltransferase family 2 protein [Gottfriedia endophytica]MBP0726469.1 glycosyltransferase family 2 protein [Gottfriedia endophytica]
MNKSDIYKRLEEIEKQKVEIYNRLNKTFSEELVSYKYQSNHLSNGVSVIVPSFKGEKVIKRCLESLKEQSLSPNLFEVIFILNGEKDNTESIINDFVAENNITNFILLQNEEASVSLARNKGIQKASRKFITFLDDDDTISANYLEKLLEYVDENSVVISQVVDVNENGNINSNTIINTKIKRAAGSKLVSHQELHSVLTMNACKIIPTRVIKTQRYDVDLKSGEDVVFFTTLFVLNFLNVKVIPVEENVIYYRYLRENSVSRKEDSFDFNISQRLEVIKRLDALLGEINDLSLQHFIKVKIQAQYSFISRFLASHQEMRNKIEEEIQKYSFVYFPFFLFNKSDARSLVISNSFLPFVDDYVSVLAKRIIEKNEVVDVIYNKISRTKETDYRLNAIVDGYIKNRIEVSTNPNVNQWDSMKKYIKFSLEKIKENERKNGAYHKIYSSTNCLASNFLAFEYKMKNSNVKWSTEFSEPVLIDINGKEGNSAIVDPKFLSKINSLMKKNNLPESTNNNLLFWAEYLAFAFADEIIFSNENHLKSMSENFPIQELKNIILQKAKISTQPTLPKQYYQAEG